MLKNLHKEITLAHKIIDLLIALFCWLIAYLLRFDSFDNEYLWYLKLFIPLLVIQYYFFRKFDLYSSKRLQSLIPELLNVFKANFAVIVTFVMSIYFFTPEKVSRIVLLNYSLLSTFLFVTTKLGIRMFLRVQRRKGKNLRHIILMGNGPQIEHFLKVINGNPEAGLKIKGWHDSNGLNEKYSIKGINLSVENLKSLNADYLIIGYFSKDLGKGDELLKIISKELIEIIILPDLSFSLIGHEISEFAGLPAISINQPRFHTKSIIAKRLFDILLSSIGLIVISPLLLFIGLGVRLTSPGSILFGQKRVGLDGHEFLMWKFRTMRADAEAQGSGWTTENDPRRTRFGSFLRKTSFDELPQLWNVLIGDMSLVGPRPEQPFFVEKFREEIDAYMLRHKMKAGITGWAQINGLRGDTSISARIEYDIWYIKNWSIWLDISIIFMTFWKGIFNKNAY